MTDKMTDEQVNEAIFKAKWWSCNKDAPVDNDIWVNKISLHGIPVNIFSSDIPDYTHNWRLAGELLEEMPGACVARDGIDGWYCGFGFSDYIDVYFEMGRGDFGSEADTPQRAICEAWLAWKEGNDAD